MDYFFSLLGHLFDCSVSSSVVSDRRDGRSRNVGWIIFSLVMAVVESLAQIQFFGLSGDLNYSCYMPFLC